MAASQIVAKYCTSDIQTFYKQYTNMIQISHPYHTNTTQIKEECPSVVAASQTVAKPAKTEFASRQAHNNNLHNGVLPNPNGHSSIISNRGGRGRHNMYLTTMKGLH